MFDFICDLIHSAESTEITPLTASLRLGVAFLLGAVIGIERQSRRQSAGMRTISLICMGSAGAMLVSIWIPQSYPHLLNGDPGRIAAQVITGIGFLGAGAIIQGRGNVHGLTTAACIWVISIIGLAVGAGLFVPATLITFLSLFILVALERWDKRRQMSGEIKILTLTFSSDLIDVEAVKKLLTEQKIYIFDVSAEHNYTTPKSVLYIKIQVNPRATMSELFTQLKSMKGLVSLSLLTP